DVGRWTYAELESVCNRVAHGLVELGIEAGEPVAILSTNCREFAAAYFGAAKAGMTALPVNLLAGAENIVHALVDSGTRVLVVHHSLAEIALGAVAAVPDIGTLVVVGGVPDGLEVPPDGPTVTGWDDLLSDVDTNPDTVIADRQVVQCLYSSGTTSRPKGVLTSHLAVTMAGLSNGAIFGMPWGATGAVTVLPLPLFHTAGLNGVLIAGITTGGTIHLQPGFDPTTYADTVARVRATHLVALPLMLEALADGADRDLDLSSVRVALGRTRSVLRHVPDVRRTARASAVGTSGRRYRPGLRDERVHPRDSHAVARTQPRQVRLVGLRHTRHGEPDLRARRPRAAAGGHRRRARLPRTHRDGGLLEQPGRQRGGVRGRPPSLGGPGQDRRRRRGVVHRSGQG